MQSPHIQAPAQAPSQSEGRGQKKKPRQAFCRGLVCLAVQGALAALSLGACNAGQVLAFTDQTSASPPQQGNTPGPAQAGARCKRGVAYNNMSPNDWRALSPGISWFYTWSGQAQPSAIAADANAMAHYVPMVWGQAQLTQMTAATLPSSDFLLGFNEPNYGAQANLSAPAAAALWPKVEALARAHNMSLVAPAVNYCAGDCQATSPFAWLDQFLASCTGCRIDAIGVHVYMCNPNDVQAYLQQFKSRYNKPLWVTEFSCLDTANPSLSQQQTLMTAVVAMLEADPMVQRYAWFTGRDPGQSAVDLLAADGALTALGQTYVSLPQACAPPAAPPS